MPQHSRADAGRSQGQCHVSQTLDTFVLCVPTLTVCVYYRASQQGDLVLDIFFCPHVARVYADIRERALAQVRVFV